MATSIHGLQFINTTDTVKIDANDRWLIRKQASRHTAAQTTQSREGVPDGERVTEPGTKIRFRLGPAGLNVSPKRARRVNQKAGASKLRPRETRKDRVALGDLAEDADAKTKSSVKLEEDEWESGQLKSLQLLLESKTSLDHMPNSGSWDPFNATAIPITVREQILLHHYCMSRPITLKHSCSTNIKIVNERKQASSPLMPYCQLFFSIAIQDKAFFHAVLSQYSATYKVVVDETKVESIKHLMAAIKLVTERLEDPEERCSNGTIGAVATLLIYESANGALPNLEYHMNGLEEMVNRRGGFKQADFPFDIQRLITW